MRSVTDLLNFRALDLRFEALSGVGLSPPGADPVLFGGSKYYG